MYSPHPPLSSFSEPVAFVDVLAPPYNPSKGRDCTYYTKEKQVLNSKVQAGRSVMEGGREEWTAGRVSDVYPLPTQEPRGCKATNEEDDK